MNIFTWFLTRPAVVDWLIRRAQKTPYTPIISPEGALYMERFWLFNAYRGDSGADRKWWHIPISVRLHHIHLPDQDRHLHDHPFNARTIILRGAYTEVRPLHPRLLDEYPFPVATRTRIGGDTAALKFGEYHRITHVSPGGVWTLFITGKYRGTWGFNVDGVKVPWRQYLGLEAKS